MTVCFFGRFNAFYGRFMTVRPFLGENRVF